MLDWGHEICITLAAIKDDGKEDVLNKAIASATTAFFLLQLDELKFSEWLEYILKILLGDTKVNVADIQAVEWD